MTRLMKQLLDRDLLRTRAQAIVEEFLEYRLKVVLLNPDLVNFTRYGVKDGDFSTFNGVTVRARTGYGETRDGTKVAFTVQLTGTPGTGTDLGATNSAPGSLDLAVRSFLVAVATNPAFALEVQRTLTPVEDALAPSLIAKIVRNESTANDVKLRVKVWNIGTAPMRQQLQLALYFSTDGTTKGNEVDHKRFGPLDTGESVEIDLNSDTRHASKYFILDIDPNNVMPAGVRNCGVIRSLKACSRGTREGSRGCKAGPPFRLNLGVRKIRRMAGSRLTGQQERRSLISPLRRQFRPVHISRRFPRLSRPRRWRRSSYRPSLWATRRERA